MIFNKINKYKIVCFTIEIKCAKLVHVVTCIFISGDWFIRSNHSMQAVPISECVMGSILLVCRASNIIRVR